MGFDNERVENMRVLAIGTHPDDIEFGVGGTLAKHILRGDEVSVVVLTDGERDEVGNHIISYERRLESTEALKILGYIKEIKFFGLRKVKVNQLLIKLIEKEINRFKPDRIYTHSINDRHQDHRTCSYTVLSAARYVSEILMFGVYSELPKFLPNYKINISRELLDLKIEAIKCFKSQFDNMEMISKMIESSAVKNSFSTYARQTKKISYSEAFEIAKMVKSDV